MLSAARDATAGNVIAVVQPHRYTRLANLFAEFCTCFNDADAVIVADVYAAGEAPIEGASTATRWSRVCVPAAIATCCRWRAPRRSRRPSTSIAKPGDLVVCLGAGSITNWAANLPAEIDQLATGARR